MEQEFSKFRESDKSLKHELESVNDPVFHMCLAGPVVASWSLIQEVAGSNPLTVMTNIFVTEFTDFSENILKPCTSVKQSVLIAIKFYVMSQIGNL